MVERARVVIGDAVLGNNHGVLSEYSRSLRENLLSRGTECEVLAFQQQDPGHFLRTLAAESAAHRNLLFFGNGFFYDLHVTAQNHYNQTSLFDALRVPVVARVDDAPYTTFMWPRLLQSPATALHVASQPVCDLGHLLFPRLTRWLAVPNFAVYPRSLMQEACDPDIDLFVPLSITSGHPIDQVVSLLQSVDEPLRRLGCYLIDTIRSHYGKVDMYLLLQSYMHDYPGAFTELQVLAVGQLMSAIDNALRIEWRQGFMARLGDINPAWQIVVTSPPPPSGAVPANIHYVGNRDVCDLWRFVARSRATLNIHPICARDIHERVINVTTAGRACITDPTLALEQVFTHGEDIVFIRSPEDLPRVSFEFAARDLDTIGVRAAGKAAGLFSVERYVVSVSAAVEQHFNLSLV